MRRITLVVFCVALAAGAYAQTPVLHVRTTRSASRAVVALTWSPVPGATQYQLRRSSSFPNWTTTWTVTGTAFNDSAAIDSAFVYQVVPLNVQSAPTNVALATTFLFSDDPLLPTHWLRAPQLTELRTIIAAARLAAGLTAPPTWTHHVQPGSPARKEDITDLRTALDAALVNVGLQPQGYLDAAVGGIRARVVHLEQIRLRVRNFPQSVSASATVNHAHFSPNADGVKDTTTLTGSLGLGTRWTINVRSAANVIVQTSSGGTSAVMYTWDGTGPGGVQPEGGYRLELVDQDGLAGHVVASATVTLDTTAPTAAISEPVAGFVASNVRQGGSGAVTVKGSANDAHFASWELKQTAPASVVIGTGSAAVPTTSSLGTWQTLPVTNGPASVQLTATDLAGNTNTATAGITVGHFRASQDRHQFTPLSGETVKYTSVIPFTVTEVLTIKNAAGHVVRTLVNEQRSAGTRNDFWNGSDGAGQVLPDGAYRYTVTVTEGASTLVWNDTEEIGPAGGTPFEYPECQAADGSWVECRTANATFDFEPFANKPLLIRYCVGAGNPPACVDTAPAWVVVKLASVAETSDVCGATECISEGYHAGGLYQIQWYGLTTGENQPSNQPRLAVIRQFGRIPRNVTVLRGVPLTVRVDDVRPLIFYPAERGTGQKITVTVSSATSRPLTLTAKFRNLTTGSVLRTVTLSSIAAGQQVIEWDGRADNGAWVAPAFYEAIITVTDTSGGVASVRPLMTIAY